MPAARILVQLTDENDTLVHEFRRTTTVHSSDSIKRLCQAALGWLQAYGDQSTPDQWAMEIEKVKLGSRPAPSESHRASR